MAMNPIIRYEESSNLRWEWNSKEPKKKIMRTKTKDTKTKQKTDEHRIR